MSRRVEAQLNRDWTFGFVSWNYIFRSSINLSRTFFVYQHNAEAYQGSGAVNATVSSASENMGNEKSRCDSMQDDRPRREHEEKPQTTAADDAHA